MPEPEPTLVPELLVTDVSASIDFWCRLCGFAVRYHRLEEGFAYLTRDGAHVMLEEIGRSRNWITAPLQTPLGRGINLQITVADLQPVLTSLQQARWPLFMEPETKHYRVNDHETQVRQFLVADPDGYLLRFQSSSR